MSIITATYYEVLCDTCGHYLRDDRKEILRFPLKPTNLFLMQYGWTSHDEAVSCRPCKLASR